jgi:hypothetical protein
MIKLENQGLLPKQPEDRIRFYRLLLFIRGTFAVCLKCTPKDCILSLIFNQPCWAEKAIAAGEQAEIEVEGHVAYDISINQLTIKQEKLTMYYPPEPASSTYTCRPTTVNCACSCHWNSKGLALRNDGCYHCAFCEEVLS